MSLSNRFAMPAPHSVGNLLSGLLARTVKVQKSTTPSTPRAPASPAPAAKASQAVAVYTDDQGSVAALCVCDMSLASHAGAALSLIPAGVAAEAARTGVMPASIAENLYEVANVAASLFNADGGPHLKLREVVTTAQALPAGLSEMAARASERIDLEVNITGYGQGQMSVLLTA